MNSHHNILIINAHWNNRGDEAALRSLIDSLIENGDTIGVQLQTSEIHQFPYDNIEITEEYPRLRNLPGFILSILTNFRFIPQKGKHLIRMMKDADLILHAPGGPSVGDIYGAKEPNYLSKFSAAKKLGKPYIFCAPSAGPFNNRIRNIWRRKVYRNANAIVLREELSQRFLNKLIPDNKSIVTCDMALQNDINEKDQNQKLESNSELVEFLNSGKVVGITITDLLWHPIHGKEKSVQDRISSSFISLIKYLTNQGYYIIFIPQLFGIGNDYKLMKEYCLNDMCYVLSDLYDTYFQQYLIGRLYAVIGMRYHSNIFSAKMKTPFISVSYEQKMRGFMEKIELTDYCIELSDLSDIQLISKFQMLENNREDLVRYLDTKSIELKRLSHRTVEIVQNSLNSLEH